jgi:uncharacterized membrane protein YkoI
MKTMTSLLMAICLTLALPAWAEVSRDAAAATAQQVSAGRVLSVEKTQQQGRTVWRVKMLTTQGEVKVILVDAATGRTL